MASMITYIEGVHVSINHLAGKVVLRSAITVTAVRVTIAYSYSFGNPRFI